MEPAPTPPTETTARASKSALLEAALEAVADQNSRPSRAVPPAARRLVLRGFLVALLAASTGVLVAQPGWLVGRKPPPESPTIQAATATMRLMAVVSRLQAHQAANGQLPMTLAGIGLADSAVSYRTGPEGYFEISTRAGDSVVSVRATDSIRLRMVEAIRTLQGRTER